MRSLWFLSNPPFSLYIFLLPLHRFPSPEESWRLIRTYRVTNLYFQPDSQRIWSTSSWLTRASSKATIQSEFPASLPPSDPAWFSATWVYQVIKYRYPNRCLESILATSLPIPATWICSLDLFLSQICSCYYLWPEIAHAASLLGFRTLVLQATPQRNKLWPHHSLDLQALSPATFLPFILHSPSRTLLLLNPRQLLLNSPSSFYLQTFKYTVPLKRKHPFQPLGPHLLHQDATFLRKPPQRWIRRSSVPQGGSVSALLILPGEGQFIVLT